MEEIKVKYFTDDIDELCYVEGKSDWIDLHAAETVTMKAGEFRLIPLGVAIALPEGYEAHIVPRSSTFKNYGILQTNSMGVVDYTYRGDGDQWRMPAYATRDVTIEKNARICQFRIMKNQPRLTVQDQVREPQGLYCFAECPRRILRHPPADLRNFQQFLFAHRIPFLSRHFFGKLRIPVCKGNARIDRDNDRFIKIFFFHLGKIAHVHFFLRGKRLFPDSLQPAPQELFIIHRQMRVPRSEVSLHLDNTNVIIFPCERGHQGKPFIFYCNSFPKRSDLPYFFLVCFRNSEPVPVPFFP